jgi:hypothetical protein
LFWLKNKTEGTFKVRIIINQHAAHSTLEHLVFAVRAGTGTGTGTGTDVFGNAASCIKTPLIAASIFHLQTRMVSVLL